MRFGFSTVSIVQRLTLTEHSGNVEVLAFGEA
jgi:hypothetical protein